MRRDTDTVIYDELLVGVEQSYAELQSVFEANGLACATDSHLNAQMQSSGSSNSMSLEIFAMKLLPFDYDATVETVWDHFVCQGALADAHLLQQVTQGLPAPDQLVQQGGLPVLRTQDIRCCM